MTAPDRPPLTERVTYAPQFKSETFMVPLLKQAIKSTIEKYATVTSGKALDVGCGGQPFRTALEKRGCRYFSLDANPTPGISVDFLCAIDGELPVTAKETGPFDFILCTEVMEHVADWEKAFQNLAGLLAENGKLVMTSPHFYFLHEEPYDFFRPTTHAFEYFAKRHGLKVVELRQLGDAWDILGTLTSACRFKALDDSWLSRTLAWSLWKTRDFVFRRIASGRIRRRVSFSGPTYLSNLVVLERTSETA